MALWIRSSAAGIAVEILTPITIFKDDNGAIRIASDPSSHKRPKHIDIKYHFSRE